MQVFIIVYIFLCLTYFLRDRKNILFLNIIAHFIQTISFLLLRGLTGAAMNVVSIAWLGYYISLKSIFAIILESILLISIIIGYRMELIKYKKVNVK